MQWKAILQLALSSYAAAASQTGFFVSLLQALHAQLALALQPDPQQYHEQGPSTTMGTLLLDGLMENSFLQHLVAQFSETLFEEPSNVVASTSAVLVGLGMSRHMCAFALQAAA